MPSAVGRLATIDMGPKLGRLCPLFRESELGPHLTQYGQGRAKPYLRDKFHLDPSNRLATIHQRHRQGRTDREDRQDR